MMKVNRISYFKLLFVLILVIGCMVAIFRFSSQVAPDSNSLSVNMTAKLIEIVDPSYHKLNEAEKDNLVRKTNHIVRKLAHFSIYFLLGILLFCLFSVFGTTVKKRLIFSLILGLLYAISDELHQLFVNGRGPQVSDVCIDFSGIIAGVILSILILNVARKLKLHVSCYQKGEFK